MHISNVSIIHAKCPQPIRQVTIWRGGTTIEEEKNQYKKQEKIQSCQPLKYLNTFSS
jgi:hypothetical protein